MTEHGGGVDLELRTPEEIQALHELMVTVDITSPTIGRDHPAINAMCEIIMITIAAEMLGGTKLSVAGEKVASTFAEGSAKAMAEVHPGHPELIEEQRVATAHLVNRVVEIMAGVGFADVN